MKGLTSGRIVHYVMPNGEHCPAIVLRVWDTASDSGCANLNVFTDYSNSIPYTQPETDNMKLNFGIEIDQVRHGHIWRTSIMFSADPVPGTWHWIEQA